MWSEISAQAVKDGRPQPTNDSWIAACCLTYDLPLATLNFKDYAYFADRHGLRLVMAWNAYSIENCSALVPRCHGHRWLPPCLTSSAIAQADSAQAPSLADPLKSVTVR